MKIDAAWDAMFRNPPDNWREVWRFRQKIARFDTEVQAHNFMVKRKGVFKGMKVDIHPKDGYVVYL